MGICASGEGGGERAVGKGNWEKLSELARMGMGKQVDTRYKQTNKQMKNHNKQAKNQKLLVRIGSWRQSDTRFSECVMLSSFLKSEQ